MFEKEITSGNHVSYHFCVDKFGSNFNPKSKHYKIDEGLSKFDLRMQKVNCHINVEVRSDIDIDVDFCYVAVRN